MNGIGKTGYVSGGELLGTCAPDGYIPGLKLCYYFFRTPFVPKLYVFPPIFCLPVNMTPFAVK